MDTDFPWSTAPTSNNSEGVLCSPNAGRQIRLLSVIDGLGFAGDESRLLSMSCNLNRSRFTHSILTINRRNYGPEDEYFDRLHQFRRAGVLVEDLDEIEPEEKSWTQKVLPAAVYRKTGILRRARRLARFIKRRGVHVLDARLESAGLVACVAGRFSGTPSCVTMYGGFTPGVGLTWPWGTRLAVKAATRVITDSEIRANQMRTFVPSRMSKVLVIPNGVPPAHSDRGVAEMRHILGLPEDLSIPVVGQIGRLIGYKGHEVFIAAARKVISELPRVAFLAVGYPRSEEYRNHLRSLATQLQIADRMIITEYSGQIGDVWKVIDIHAHASLFDSLPISIAEGMSVGKPAVVSDAGGIPEIVSDEETGLVVRTGDPAALAEGILRLLRNPSFARQLGANARTRYEKTYRPEKMTRQLESAFAALA